MGELRFELSTDLDAEKRESICCHLRAHNHARSPIFFAARDEPEHARISLIITAYDGDGSVLGGLIADTQFAWLKIDILSIRESSRRRGIGTQLMHLAEAEAIRRNCRYAYVDTMSYQAPDFYKRLGYTQCGFFPDWDSHGHDKHEFMKRLA